MCQLVLSVHVHMGHCELLWYSQLPALSTASAYFLRCIPELLRGGFPEYSASNISWIGSIQAFLLTSLGLLTGPLYVYGYLRSLVISGSALTVLGMILTSFCSQYWQVLCSQGLLLGLGSGCLFVPSVAVLPTYFDKRQRLALGVGAAGSAFGMPTLQKHDWNAHVEAGGIIFPIMFQRLQPRIGFGWTTRIIGLIMLALLALPVLGMRMRVRPSTALSTCSFQ